MKRTQPRRDWTDANPKRNAGCRICGQHPAELAHTVGRRYDKPKECAACHGTGQQIKVRPGVWGNVWEEPCKRCKATGELSVLYVHPESIVPLCAEHHRAYDAHQLDLLPHLSMAESLKAVELAGGIELARVRLAPGLYERKVVA